MHFGLEEVLASCMNELMNMRTSLPCSGDPVAWLPSRTTLYYQVPFSCTLLILGLSASVSSVPGPWGQVLICQKKSVLEHMFCLFVLENRALKKTRS